MDPDSAAAGVAVAGNDHAGFRAAASAFPGLQCDLRDHGCPSAFLSAALVFSNHSSLWMLSLWSRYFNASYISGAAAIRRAFARSSSSVFRFLGSAISMQRPLDVSTRQRGPELKASEASFQGPGVNAGDSLSQSGRRGYRSPKPSASINSRAARLVLHFGSSSRSTSNLDLKSAMIWFIELQASKRFLSVMEIGRASCRERV